MRRIVASVIAIACMMTYGVPMTRSAMMEADVKKEIQTAIFHAAELSQRANAVAGVRVHLQHVINCLEGPDGKNFKAAAGVPCEGMGHGVIPDLKSAMAAKMPGADEALKQATLAWNLAVQAMSKDDLNESQAWARVVSNYLKASLAALGS